MVELEQYGVCTMRWSENRKFKQRKGDSHGTGIIYGIYRHEK